MNRLKIIKEHPQTKDLFPLGFETTYKVEPKTIPKGTLKSILIVAINGKEYDTDFFYRATGRSFTEFVKKIK